MVSADGQVIDVFTAAGLQKPDLSILSDQFLAEVRGLKHKNVAAGWHEHRSTRAATTRWWQFRAAFSS